MSEVLDLGNAESISHHRDAMVADLPDILMVAGANDQVSQLIRGQHDEVVNWFRGTVSVQAHGANAGGIGLTPEQTLAFNPIAREHGLMAPTRLWTPEDDLPEGAKIGDIVRYSVLPDYDTLAQNIFNADETLVVDARFDGTIGRIDAGLGAVVRSQPKDGVRRLTILSGMRAIGADEGATGLYREFLPFDIPADTPIEQVFPSATDAALAIAQSRCSKFELLTETSDEVLGEKAPNRTDHPLLGARKWVTRTYQATHAESGVDLLVTVVNGEAVRPTGSEMNRSTKTPAPTAAETLKDYLRVRDGYIGDVNLGISYAHLGRIGAELIKATEASADTPRSLGAISLVGSMPQRATWDRIVNGNHNGGTLGLKEVYPYIKALNVLLGRTETDLGI